MCLQITHTHTHTYIYINRIWYWITYNDLEGSYLPSNRKSPKSERIENAPLTILISTEQFNSMLVLASSEENVHRFGAFLLTVLFTHRPSSQTWDPIISILSN